MSSDVTPKRGRRLPPEIIARIRDEAGSMTDAELAKKYSKIVGYPLDRHRIFYLRTSNGTPAAKTQAYTKPVFHGRLEDAYPELRYLIGVIDHTTLAARYQVSRSAVREAAKRLAVDPAQQLERVINVFRSVVGAEKPKPRAKTKAARDADAERRAATQAAIDDNLLRPQRPSRQRS